jgi:hypothetical protein
VGYRDVVNVLAAVVFFAVIAVGVQALGTDDVRSPREVTTVSKGGTPSQPGGVKVTTVVTREDGKVKNRQTTTERTPETPAGAPTTEKTVKNGERTFLERVLGEQGLVLLQIAVLVLAAFLAAAALQRVLLGKYALKLAGLELAELTTEAATSAAALKSAIEKTQADSLRGDAEIKEQLQSVVAFLDLLERRVGQVERDEP